MTTKTLDEYVSVQKSAVRVAQAKYDEAAQLLRDLRDTPTTDPSYALAQRQIPDAELAVAVVGADLENARRELRQAYADARQQILDEGRDELRRRIAAVDKSLSVLVRDVKQLDDFREALVAKLDGAAELVPILTPLPFAAERVAHWREAMTSEHLL